MNRLFIINPAAGSGRGLKRWREWSPSLARAGVTGDELVTTRPGEAMEAARRAGAERDLVVAAGGDGTVFETLNGLLHGGASRAALAIAPLGTGNDAAEAAGTGSLESAGRALARGTTRPVDVIRIDCRLGGRPIVRHAFLFAAAGITSETLRLTTPLVKRLFGPRLAYPVGLMRAVWSYRPPAMQVRCDDKMESGQYLLVAASNTERAGGTMRLAPGARVDDGLLNVNLINAVPPWEAIRQIQRASRGRHLNHPRVRYFPARSVSIDAEPPIAVEADGETVGETPARFAVIPGLLRLVTGG